MTSNQSGCACGKPKNHCDPCSTEQRPSKELVTCATHAAEHRMRDTLPCPWCVIDELKRGRDTLQTTVEYFNAQLYRLAKVVQKDGETAEAVVTKTIEILADWPTEPPSDARALLERAEELFQDECDPLLEPDSYAWLQDVRECLRPSPTKSVLDACEICEGSRGGVPGNENIVESCGEKVTMCDYCSADEMRMPGFWKEGPSTETFAVHFREQK